MEDKEKMTLRKGADEINGLGFVLENMEVLSGPGRRMLLHLPYLTDAASIESELDAVESVRADMESHGAEMDAVCLQLMQLRDIHSTIRNLDKGLVPDDVDLYELKALALIAEEVCRLCGMAGSTAVEVPDLTAPLDILDPEGQRVPSFYVYDCYSRRLAELRHTLKELRAAGEEKAADAEECYRQSVEEEDRVRVRLAEELKPYAPRFASALEALGRLDVLIAKVRLNMKLHLVRPRCSRQTTVYRGLFNPQVAEVLRRRGREFQPVDITIEPGTTIITGANMAGKSVVLKTVALAQAMCQYGFYVPAAEATVIPVDEILVSMGDRQSELDGLSSFASEMLKINSIIQKIKGGESALVLIDEPARTTNPTEGKALVNAIADYLHSASVPALITTHYSGIATPCRRLRVKGLRPDVEASGLDVGRIDECIDYSLMPDSDTEVPHEALRIARMLGVDSDITQGAETYLKKY